MDTSKLITIRHYAESKGIVKQTVSQWIKKGKIKSILIDGVIFIINE